MIVSVSSFDIPSPLPPRKIPALQPEEFPNSPLPNQTTVPTPPLPTTTASPVVKKNVLKNYWPIGAIVVVLLLIFVVVSKFLLPNLKSPTASTITLNYWGLWEDSNIIDGLISQYESQNPGIKINYIKNSKTDYRTRLAGRLNNAGSTSQDVPDIFRIHATWLPMMKSYMAPVPTTVANDIKMDSDFFDVYKTDLKENGNYWAIPLMYDGLALFYNKSILDSAGISPPKTWWGLRDSAKKLTVKDASGKINIAGVAMGVTDNVDHWSDIVGTMLKQNGVDLFKGDDANKQKLQDVLTFYTLFRTSDQVWDETLPNSTLDFANGKLAYYFGPSWRIFDIDQINPNLSYGVAPLPQLPTLSGVDPALIESGQAQGNLTNINWATYWAEGVSNKSKYQKEAWKFLTFLASSDGLQKFYQSASQVRSFGELYPRKSMAASLSSNPKLKTFLDGAGTASSWYLSSRTFDSGVNDDMIGYFADAINGIVQKNDQPGDVMTPLMNGINQTIAKYHLTH